MRQGVCGVDVGVCGGWVSRWVGGCGCVRACVRARVRTCVCVCGCVCLCVCVLICVHVQMRMPRKGYTLFRGQCLSLLLFLAYQLCTFACVCVIFRVGQNRIYTPYTKYIWWFPCQKYRIHTVYIWFWPTLYIRYWPTLVICNERANCQNTHKHISTHIHANVHTKTHCIATGRRVT